MKIALQDARRASRLFGLRREAKRHAAFVRARALDNVLRSRPGESGGERAALQTLRAFGHAWQSRERLECGGFSTAFARASVFGNSMSSSRGPKRRRRCALPAQSKMASVCFSAFASKEK
jgi:hypothetical protein